MINEVYHVLLGLTFAVHWCFIALLVGTPPLAILERLRGEPSADGPWSFLRHQYPVCISLTITTGVAPLLFSQTLFHRSFYQTFINLYPLPIVGLFLLTAFFYTAYAIVHVERLALPLAFVQIAFTAGFMLFFGAVFNGITHPQDHAAQFWNHTWPPWLWHSFGAHFVASLIAGLIFFGLRRRGWIWRSVPLLLLGVIVSLSREVLRTHFLAQAPRPRVTQLDPSMGIFVVCLLGMIVVLYKAVRIAFPKEPAKS